MDLQILQEFDLLVVSNSQSQTRTMEMVCSRLMPNLANNHSMMNPLTLKKLYGIGTHRPE